MTPGGRVTERTVLHRWVLPIASCNLSLGWPRRFVQPHPLAHTWPLAADPLADVGYNVEVITVSRLAAEVTIPVEIAMPRMADTSVAEDWAIRTVMRAMSERLLADRLVSAGPLEVERLPPTAFGKPDRYACVLPTVPAVPGATVEILSGRRRSDALLPGFHTVMEDGSLEEGLVLMDTWARTVTVGARPLSWAHRTALETIRGGLADVLAWLGEPVETPMHHEVMHAIRTGRGPGWPAVEHALISGSSARPSYRGMVSRRVVTYDVSDNSRERSQAL